MHRVIKISNGLKIKCKEYQLNVLLSEHTITDKFKLNIKRLNRWWYSVYFQSKGSDNFDEQQ